MAENRTVCHCMNVDYDTIVKAINDGATSVEKIQEKTNAGTSCGGCIVEIEEILAEIK